MRTAETVGSGSSPFSELGRTTTALRRRASGGPTRRAPFGARFGRRSVVMARRPCASSAYRTVRSSTDFPVRDGLGRAGWFGRPRGNPFPVFGLLAPNRALRRIENPRVAGSIPALATISKSMIRNGFRVSPADHPWPSMADPRTIGNRAAARRRGRGGGSSGAEARGAA